MTAGHYRLKPALVDAFQYDDGNAIDVVRWIEAAEGRFVPASASGLTLVVATRSGQLTLLPGDRVIRDQRGVHTACPAELFDHTYESVHTQPAG